MLQIFPNVEKLIVFRYPIGDLNYILEFDLGDIDICFNELQKLGHELVTMYAPPEQRIEVYNKNRQRVHELSLRRVLWKYSSRSTPLQTLEDLLRRLKNQLPGINDNQWEKIQDDMMKIPIYGLVKMSQVCLAHSAVFNCLVCVAV